MLYQATAGRDTPKDLDTSSQVPAEGDGGKCLKLCWNPRVLWEENIQHFKGIVQRKLTGVETRLS